MKIDFQKIIVGLSLALATFAVALYFNSNDKYNELVAKFKTHEKDINIINRELYVAPTKPRSNIQRNAVKETLRKYNYLFNKP